MRGHVILSHGLNSSPDATKVSALARVAESLGWSHERPDYRDIDASNDVREIATRRERLLARARAAQGPLVLAGSSLGAFISAQASLETGCIGLFLMAPPVSIDGLPAMQAAAVPTTLIHAWRDELIPAGDVVRWAQPRLDRLVLVDDTHRLEGHVEFCAAEFGRFLAALQ